ncbi:DUF1501 domain-containing protein [soil metagenome]
MNRREFLQLAALSSLSLALPGSRGWAYSNGKDDDSAKKLIVILLRGGMDGLNVIAPYGDSQYQIIRPTIALHKSNGGLIDLDSYFGMHPALAPLHPLFQDKTLAFVHACGSPDPTRSHFDAQDYMESGIPGKKSASSGWVNRLVTQLPSKHSPLQAISIGSVLPRICSGPANFASVAKNSKVSRGAIDRPKVETAFNDLYSGLNNDLGASFAEGMAAHKTVNQIMSSPDDIYSQGDDKEQMMANRGAVTPNAYPNFGKQLATLFRKDPSVQVAFVDFGGWDTHIRQGAEQGPLAGHLAPLASGLADLVKGLGPLYKDTSIVVMSEFGRTVKENGNGGTDHGHGNVMWLLGGGVNGGKVYGRFGGLKQNELYEDRDLPATTDFRSVLSAVLADQMHLPKNALANVFPGFQASGKVFVS